MAREPSLTKRFPGRWVNHIKVWTPDRTRIEITGPVPEHLGELLTMISTARHDTKTVRAIKRIVSHIQKRGDMPLEEYRKLFPFWVRRPKDRFAPPLKQLTLEFAEEVVGHDQKHFVDELAAYVQSNPGRIVFDFTGTKKLSPFWQKALKDDERFKKVPKKGLRKLQKVAK